MTKFHVNPATGEPGLCRATKSPCPFGSVDEHYASLTEARSAYENKMSSLTKNELYELSLKKTPWRSQPFEDRQAKLNSLAVEAFKKTRLRGKLVILWEEDLGKPGKMGGAKKLRLGLYQIRLSTSVMEELDSTSSMENVLHEIAHLPHREESHNGIWREKAKSLAADLGVLPEHDFPEGTVLSPQENFRVDFATVVKRAPKFIAHCKNDHSHISYSKSESNRPKTCYECVNHLGYLSLSWEELVSKDEIRQWTIDNMP